MRIFAAVLFASTTTGVAVERTPCRDGPSVVRPPVVARISERFRYARRDGCRWNVAVAGRQRRPSRRVRVAARLLPCVGQSQADKSGIRA